MNIQKPSTTHISIFTEHILGTAQDTNTQTNLQTLYKTHKHKKLKTLEQFEIYTHYRTHKEILSNQITYKIHHTIGSPPHRLHTPPTPSISNLEYHKSTFSSEIS